MLMSLHRIFSLICCIFAIVGVIWALKVPLTYLGGPGPGFTPLLYSVALFFFGVLFFFQDKSNKKFNFRASLLTGTGGKAFVFFLFNILLLLLIYAFGPFVAILVFSVLACFVLKRQTWRSIVLFSIITTTAFYYVFVVLFKISFQRGIIFRMLGWYI